MTTGLVLDRPRTLATRLWPSQSLAASVARIIVFSVVIAASAQLEIRLGFTPVPITGQTFGVLLTGIALGSREGALAVLLYLAEGAVGLPVFAGGVGGLAKFLGPTGGYLASFPVAAALTGVLAERGWDRNSLWVALPPRFSKAWFRFCPVI
jgi:biotin transport system substrate-specific component